MQPNLVPAAAHNAPAAVALLTAKAFSFERLHEAVFRTGRTCRRADWGSPERRLIAGTYTPLCMLALDHATATRLLCIEWGAAFLGMVRPCFFVLIC